MDETRGPSRPQEPVPVAGWPGEPAPVAGWPDEPPPVAGGPEPPDDRSYAERYRGTPWSGLDPAVPPAVAAERRGGRLLVRAGTLLLGACAVATVVLAAAGLMGGERPLPTLPPPEPARSVDPAAAAAVVDAFAAVAADAGLTFEVRVTETSRAGGRITVVRLSSRVAGPDSETSYAITPERGERVEGIVVVKGAKAWHRVPGHAGWQAVPVPVEVASGVGILRGIVNAADLVYVAPERRRNVAGHHLRTVEDWRPPATTGLVAVQPWAAVEAARLDLWVRDDGRPVEARLVVQMRSWSASSSAEAVAVYRAIGSAISIQAPKPAR